MRTDGHMCLFYTLFQVRGKVYSVFNLLYKWSGRHYYACRDILSYGAGLTRLPATVLLTSVRQVHIFAHEQLFTFRSRIRSLWHCRRMNWPLLGKAKKDTSGGRKTESNLTFSLVFPRLILLKLPPTVRKVDR